MLNQTTTIKSAKTYFYLNNLVNIPINGEIPLQKDQEALKAYFEEEIIPNTLTFPSLEEKLAFLVDNNYIDLDVLNLYRQPNSEGYDFVFIKKI